MKFEKGKKKPTATQNVLVRKIQPNPNERQWNASDAIRFFKFLVFCNGRELRDWNLHMFEQLSCCSYQRWCNILLFDELWPSQLITVWIWMSLQRIVRIFNERPNDRVFDTFSGEQSNEHSYLRSDAHRCCCCTYTGQSKAHTAA